MGRGRNPEQTRQKILEVAEKLFLEKGYDDTTIQDIIDGLGGMTKGVIYHHFKSKFNILETLMSEVGDTTAFIDWQGNTGMEKLQNSMERSFTSYKKQSIGYSAAITLRSPRIIGENYLQLFSESVPQIKAIVEEGVQDGSIQTDFPEEIAELMLLTMNLWIGFQTSELSEAALRRKMLFVKQLFDGIGVPLISDELLEESYKLFAVLKK
ncbi:TetR/AcrR family transcriptional regulator [Enterococcus sp. 669A]|uniref:TetR/AcrR family transcriptional regulator n=1 Tax=Candidatus Enterococcus moelleringii TaxID=2815325 RepID=A0ABS3L8G7_9ENTE|nr:TetR/AcrR family transcriptional regulator [Enterococcus sp. 669A]MBO1305922.1 TetR/AcrR family transcriptional regulator [Enterococcus sp. 669A]